MKTVSLVIFLIISGIAVTYGQDKKSQKAAAKAEKAEIECILKAYTSCRFEDGLKVTRVDRIQRGGLKYIARPTAKGLAERGTPSGKNADLYFVNDEGVRYEGVTRTDSLRVMVDYGKPNFFANIRVDRSSTNSFEDDKEILVRWMNFIHSERTDSETRFPIEGYYNGFEAYSTNRKDVDVEKDELGITLLFDDKNRISVTIYLLNQFPRFRVHKTTDEWKELREKLLYRYTACVRDNLSVR